MLKKQISNEHFFMASFARASRVDRLGNVNKFKSKETKYSEHEIKQAEFDSTKFNNMHHGSVKTM